jgi:hypothetical protein
MLLSPTISRDGETGRNVQGGSIQRPGADDLAQGVADAAAPGRSERCSSKRIAHIPGCIDAVTGEIELDDLAYPEVDDLLDSVGELVLENRSQIVNCAWPSGCLRTRVAPSIGTKRNSGSRGHAPCKARQCGGLPGLRTTVFLVSVGSD